MIESNLLEEMIFETLTPIEVPVKIASVPYVLKEASGDADVRFQNARVARYEYNEEGKLTRLRDTADLEPLLVSLCLFDAAGQLVPEATIRSWPSRIQSKLFDRAKEISSMDEAGTLEALEKQLAVLQKQIAKLKKVEDPVKNS